MNLKCITTLPLLPPASPIPLDKAISPLFADVLAKRCEFAKVLALNLIGPKLYEMPGYIVRGLVDSYLNVLGRLGIKPDFLWRDDAPENRHPINEIVSDFVKRELIYQSVQEVERCNCGAVENLAGVTHVSARRSLSYFNKQTKLCKLCHQEIKCTKESVYLFRFPDVSQDIRVFPSFYEKELGFLAHKFAGANFLVSKTRKTAVSVNLQDHSEIQLDIDFALSMFLNLLEHHGYNPYIVVGSRRNLLALLFLIANYKLTNNKQILIVIHPYFLSGQRKPLTDEGYSVENLLAKYDSKSLRLFLATGINWRRKDSVLNFDELRLLDKMSYRVNSRQTRLNESIETIKNLDGEKIKHLLRRARSQRTTFEFEELWGIV